VAQTLAGLGCAAAFFGASELTTHRLASAVVLIPLLAGLVMIVALVAYEYLIERPLMPIRSIATTFPVAGIIVAMCAGAASVAVVDLVLNALQTKMSPAHLGTLFWPEFGAAAATAVLFGLLFRTRFVPLLAFGGLLMLSAAAALLTGATNGSDMLVAVGSGLLGVGVGASVSPALFQAGFSLQSAQLPRVFALIELLRGVSAFMIGPILLHVAQTVGANPARGTKTALWRQEYEAGSRCSPLGASRQARFAIIGCVPALAPHTRTHPPPVRSATAFCVRAAQVPGHVADRCLAACQLSDSGARLKELVGRAALPARLRPEVLLGQVTKWRSVDSKFASRLRCSPSLRVGWRSAPPPTLRPRSRSRSCISAGPPVRRTISLRGATP
jgi:hypothetical protein